MLAAGSLHPSLPRPPWDPLALGLDLPEPGHCSLVGMSACHLICLAALSVVLGWRYLRKLSMAFKQRNLTTAAETQQLSVQSF